MARRIAMAAEGDPPRSPEVFPLRVHPIFRPFDFAGGPLLHRCEVLMSALAVLSRGEEERLREGMIFRGAR